MAGIVLPFWSLMVRYRFTPTSKLPAKGPFILAPNHMSEIDPVAIGAAVWHLGRLPRFLAKASLFKVPGLAMFLRASGQIPVYRAGDSARGASRTRGPLGAAQQLIDKSAGVIVYPEGTLTRDENLWPMRGKSGAVRLALESGIPLYPAAQWGTQLVMGRYSRAISFFPRKTVRIAVGEPLDLNRFAGRPLDKKTLDEATALLMREITLLLATLRQTEAPPGLQAGNDDACSSRLDVQRTQKPRDENRT